MLSARLKLFRFLPAVIGILAVTSCNNDPISDLSLEETQVYFTNRDKAVDFKAYKTFSITDSVYVTTNQGAGTSLTATDLTVLNRLVQNMKAQGYTYVGPQDNPDLGITVQLVNNTYINVIQTPIGGYWGGYWGGYNGWGYGIPSYYSYQQVQEMYWIINMLDFKNPDTVNQRLKVVWNAQIRGEGLYENSLAGNMIDKIFEQSGYLKVN